MPKNHNDQHGRKTRRELQLHTYLGVKQSVLSLDLKHDPEGRYPDWCWKPQSLLSASEVMVIGGESTDANLLKQQNPNNGL